MRQIMAQPTCRETWGKMWGNVGKLLRLFQLPNQSIMNGRSLWRLSSLPSVEFRMINVGCGIEVGLSELCAIFPLFDQALTLLAYCRSVRIAGCFPYSTPD